MSNFERSVTIDIADSSPTTLTLNYGRLTGGQWQDAPAPGSIIKPGNNKSYVNGAATSYEALGGQIVLTPASGGLITIKWSWNFGSAVSGTVTSDGLDGLVISKQWINTQSHNPTYQITISGESATKLLRANS
jgi:hypothetical protein